MTLDRPPETQAVCWLGHMEVTAESLPGAWPPVAVPRDFAELLQRALDDAIRFRAALADKPGREDDLDLAARYRDTARRLARAFPLRGDRAGPPRG